MEMFGMPERLKPCSECWCPHEPYPEKYFVHDDCRKCLHCNRSGIDKYSSYHDKCLPCITCGKRGVNESGYHPECYSKSVIKPWNYHIDAVILEGSSIGTETHNQEIRIYGITAVTADRFYNGMDYQTWYVTVDFINDRKNLAEWIDTHLGIQSASDYLSRLDTVLLARKMFKEYL